QHAPHVPLVPQTAVRGRLRRLLLGGMCGCLPRRVLLRGHLGALRATEYSARDVRLAGDYIMRTGALHILSLALFLGLVGPTHAQIDDNSSLRKDAAQRVSTKHGLVLDWRTYSLTQLTDAELRLDAVKRIAFPVDGAKDSNSIASMHFGNASHFLIVDFDEKGKSIIKEELVDNIPHSMGGCMMPVNLLASKKIDFMVVNGIGGRPLMGFQQMNITVLHNSNPEARIKDLLMSVGQLQVMEQSTCDHH
nr:NifB/NifX family molybdenum-iron cluster-binding protein [Candidatus Sigynarchaeota archaeon]